MELDGNTLSYTFRSYGVSYYYLFCIQPPYLVLRHILSYSNFRVSLEASSNSFDYSGRRQQGEWPMVEPTGRLDNARASHYLHMVVAVRRRGCVHYLLHM